MSELDHLLAALDEAAEPESRQRDPHAAPALALQLAQLPELESASDETALRAARALAVHGPPQT
ncbi:MAG TPA: hypothetical protein DEP69_01435, partial [Acidimicrobiaceae bacterium]|nr:hypothetical protein [Acidimicrobiaceae bacterium]